MSAQQPGSASSNRGLPLFMWKHTIVDNRSTMPREGVDFVYDAGTQKAAWSNADATNKWSPTSYSDTKVDGVDYVAVNVEPSD